MALALENGWSRGAGRLNQVLVAVGATVTCSSRMTGVYIHRFLGAITNCGDIRLGAAPGPRGTKRKPAAGRGIDRRWLSFRRFSDFRWSLCQAGGGPGGTQPPRRGGTTFRPGPDLTGKMPP